MFLLLYNVRGKYLFILCNSKNSSLGSEGNTQPPNNNQALDRMQDSGEITQPANTSQDSERQSQL